MGASRGRIKLPTDGQNRIANAFGIEPMAIHSPQQFVSRIDGQAIVAIGTRHLIRPRKDNQPVHLLDRPAAPP